MKGLSLFLVLWALALLVHAARAQDELVILVDFEVGNETTYSTGAQQTLLNGVTYGGGHYLEKRAMPTFPITVLPAHGSADPFTGYFRLRTISGHTKPHTEPRNQPTPSTEKNIALPAAIQDLLWIAGMRSDVTTNQGAYDFIVAMDDDEKEVEKTFTIKAEWMNSEWGTVEDSLTIPVRVKYRVTIVEGFVYPRNFSIRYEETPATLFLYDNGGLPPTGRPAFFPEVEPEKTHRLEGSITNNDDEPRFVEIWEQDAEGNVSKVGEIEIAPGQTVQLDGIGFNLGEGNTGFITVDGEVTGTGSPTLAAGDNALDLTFPPQSTRPQKFTIENTTGDTVPVEIGQPIPVETITAPPGVSEVERVTRGTGTPTIGGGTVVHDNGENVVVAVPPTTTPATVEGTATTPGGGTTTVVRLPSGNTVAVTPPTNPTSPNPASPVPPTAGGFTSSGLSDEAARQLAQIRAEMAATAAANKASVDSAPQITPAASLEEIQEGEEAIGQITDDAMGSSGFFFFQGVALPTVAIGQQTSLTVASPLGGSMTLSTDWPWRPWIRGLILASMVVGALIWAISYART